VSRWVEAHPEHWFGWFHRRFKDKVLYDGPSG
jgi:lauroyl/myristoyl acyltransferase